MSDLQLDYTDEVLVKGLKSELEEGQASYIRDRHMISVNPTTSSTLNPTSGARVVQFTCSSDFIDGASGVQLQFTLKNNSATLPLRLLDGPWVLWNSMRVSCGGVIISEWPQDFGRLYTQLNLLSNPAHKHNQNILNGYFIDNGMVKDPDGVYTDYPDSIPRNRGLSEPIPGVSGAPDNERVMCFTLPAGLFTSGRIIPAKAMGSITIEMSLVSDPWDAVFGRTGSSKHSNDWSVLRPTLKMQELVIDAPEAEKLHDQVKNGTMNFTCKEYTMLSQSLSGPDFRANFQRALNQLNTVFVSYFRKNTGTVQEGSESINIDGEVAITFDDYLKRCNQFWVDVGTPNSHQFIVGSKLIPQQPTEPRAFCQMFQLLLDAVGVHAARDGVSISHHEYKNNGSWRRTRGFGSFMFGLNLEKYPAVALSGVETRNKTLQVYGQGVGTTTNYPEELFLTLHYNVYVECRGIGHISVSE